MTNGTDTVARGPGRPPVSPGEPGIEIRFSIGVSEFRQLRLFAQRRRKEIPDVLREVFRELFVKNLTDDSPSS